MNYFPPNQQERRAKQSIKEERTLTERLELLLQKNEALPLFPFLRQIDSTLDSRGNSIYHHLCAYNNKLVKILLEQKLFVDELNCANDQNLKPVQVAAMFCPSDIVTSMYELGARGNIAYWSCRGGSDFISYQGDYTDKKGNSAVHYAAENDLLVSLKKIYSEKGLSQLTKRNAAGLTPLAIAIDCISYNAAEFLLGVVNVSSLAPHELDLVEQSSSPFLKELFQKELQKQKKSKSRIDVHFQLTNNEAERGLGQRCFHAVKGNSGRLTLVGSQFLMVPLFQEHPPAFLCFILAIILMLAAQAMSSAQAKTEISQQQGRYYTFKSALFDVMVRWGKRHFVYMLTLALLSGQFAMLPFLKREGWVFGALQIAAVPISLSLAVTLVLNVVGVLANVMPLQLSSPLLCKYMVSKAKVDYSGYALKQLEYKFGRGCCSNVEEYWSY